MRTADCACFAGEWDNEIAQRSRHDALIGRIGPYSALYREARPGIELYEYLQPTYGGPAKYNLGLTRDLEVIDPAGHLNLADAALRQEFARRCANYLRTTDLDGLFMDTPFEHLGPWDGVQMCAEIATAIAPKRVVVNFGDFGSAFISRSSWLLTARTLFTERFVQVGFDLEHHDASLFHVRRSAVFEFLGRRAAGRCFFGLHDPDGRWPGLAMDLARSFDTERVVAYYQSGTVARPGWNWNPYY